MEAETRKLLKNPRQSAGFLSVIFFGWSFQIIKDTYRDILNPSDVVEPLNQDTSDQLGDRLQRKWQEEVKTHEKPSLLRALAKTFWKEVLILGIFCFYTDCFCRFMLAFFLESFLSYFRENSGVTRDDAMMYAGIFFGLTVTYGIALLHYLYKGLYYSMRLRVALSSMVYRKTLRLSQRTVSDMAPGKLVNLLSNDIQRFNSVALLHPLWISPLVTIICGYILWINIHWAGIMGMALIFLLVPIQSYAGKLAATTRFKTATRTDDRVRFMNEIISGVQVIKMYAWEKPFEKLIAATRRLELKMVLRSGYIHGFNMALSIFATRAALYCTVLSYFVLYGREDFTLSKMFMTSYLFGIISLAMCRIFPLSLSLMGETFIAIQRLQKFLEYEEKSEQNKNESSTIATDRLEADGLSISLKNGSAKWLALSSNKNDKSKNSKKITAYTDAARDDLADIKPFGLEGLNLDVMKGKLVFVVGPVGAGKSTFLQVLLKELPLVEGSLGVNGLLSYASQVSWTFTSSIRQNITFGQTMDKLRYDEVIHCTALSRDFRQFSSGDMTLVGENGAGLSGGQKARINLARALYRKADIFLLDDPLSAVDSHVQSHLFNKCIGPNGFLAKQNATRILVTHQLHFMKEADLIIVLKDGKIEAQGDYDSILRKGIDFASILNDEESGDLGEFRRSLSRRSSSSSVRSRKSSFMRTDDTNEDEDKAEAVQELEASSKGKVEGSMFWNYFKAANMPFNSIILLVLFILTQTFASVADVWVSYWIREEESRVIHDHAIINNQTTFDTDPSAIWPTSTYIYIYSGIIAISFIVAAWRSFLFYAICLSASQSLHDKMFHGLISTSMRFFSENPIGRIMNRFTKDLGSADEMLPRTIMEASQRMLIVFGAVAVTLSTDFKFVLVMAVMSVPLLLARRIYLKCSKNIMRLEGITKSPVFTHISSTLGGLDTVRAFQAEQILQFEFERHQDLNTGTYFMFLGASNGFSFSLDIMVYIFTGCVLCFFLFINEGVTGDRVGLAITQTFILTGTLQMGIKQSAEIPNQLTSVERVLEYGQLEQEKQPDSPKEVAKDWPSAGKIEFKKVFYRYSPDNEPVLRGLSFVINPREKVSVVGRTGAGKSSLISSIFRLAIVEGDIILDDVNANSIELSVLRSRISIIPQEPILYSGSLRRNLDPFEEYSDDNIWSALEDVGMKEYVSKSNGLQMAVAAHGQNFSTGQRQILCLARAILRRNRVIILDEATANVDHLTDEMIQKTIREKFVDSTVITVAHRLNTVIDSDRVIVMDAGVAVEFDEPYLLMQDKHGVFHKMVEALGSQEYDRLHSKAKAKFDSKSS